MTLAAAPAGGCGALVAARGIGVQRGERWIFRHVQLTVNRGELVYLIGANGAGKSTCAKAVLGLIEIDGGIVERPPSIGVGYVPQRLAATVSPDLATVAGLRPERARLIFGILVAAVIAAAIKIVGVLLIVALLIIPAATVRRFASSPERMAAGAVAMGVAAVAGGLLASANLDTPSGPSIVVVALALFIVTRAGGPRPG